MEQDKARSYALRLLKYRPRTRKEILERLRKKNFSSESIEKTIQDLTDLGLIDDRAFVKFWINWRKEVNPRSKNFVLWELRQKGISPDLIEEEIKAISSEVDFLQAKELAKRRFEKFKYLTPDKAKRRIYGYLQRRGFAQEVIFEVIKTIFKS
ncbi:MAG: recombination regulator RecX [Candidatus Omnitrophica bacterium]|nr:recombination regulator RecX [Candidatus Omnitrophota bacterium]